MTHYEKLFMALYLSEAWYVRFSENLHVSQSQKLYARTRAVILFDRVTTEEDAHNLSRTSRNING